MDQEKKPESMSVKHTDSDQTLPLTSISSFGPPDMVTINTAISAGQPVVTNQVPNLLITNPNTNATNHSIVSTSINLDARLEGYSGCSLGPAQMECQSITLIVHQELGAMPLWTQWLNYQDVLIEFDGEVDVEGVAQKLLWMGWWMGPHVTLSVSPVALKEVFYSSGEGNG